MKAIWKRDLTAYFNSPVGCVFLFAFATIMNLCFYLFNVLGASSQISNLFSIMLFLLILLAPFLTMRLFSEEYKLHTDQLLLTSPTELWEIVAGKFLAAFCVLLCGMALTLVWLAVIALFGVVSPGIVLGNYAAVICASAAFISIGLLISSLTENQIIAAVGTFAVILLLFVLSAMADASLSPTLGRLLSWVSLFSRHQRFLLGIFSLSDILYYLSFTGVMLFLTSRVLERKRGAAHAGWSAAFTAVVIAAAVAANLLAGAAETRFSLTLDMTGDELYALSADTEEFLDDMKEEFTISVLGDPVTYAQGVRTGVINEILKRYQSASGGRVRLEYIDTYTNPGVLSKYQNENIEENGIIVEGGGGHRVISMSELFGIRTSEVTLSAQVTDCRAEQVLTTALLALSAETQPQIYLVEGHGETYYDRMTEKIEDGSYKLGRLSLTSAEIPADADLLVISGPQADFSAEELTRLDDYLKELGSLILLYGSNSPDLPNLDRYLSELGVRFERNIIVDPSRYVGNAVQISPLLTEEKINEKYADMTDRFLLTPGARAIAITGKSTGTQEIAPVLSTSEASYAKSYANQTGTISTVEKEPGDAQGPMNIGVLVRNADVAEGQVRTGSVLFLSSPSMFSDSLMDTSNLLNDYYFMNTISYMTGGTGEYVSIPSRNMQDNALNVVGVGNGVLLFAVVGLPSAAVLLFGVLRFLTRRKL